MKKNRCLFDHNDPNYKNSVFVDRGWQEVSKEFGEPVPECKKKWRHLRSSLSRYIKSSKDELKNKNNKLKPYYLLTHMNFLVPYTKTLDTKSDTVVCNTKFEPPPDGEVVYDEEMKAEDEPSNFEHEIIQDEDSHELEGNIVYEAYEIQEQVPSSSAAATQSQGKSQITLVRSSHSNNQTATVQQLPITMSTISSPKTQTLQLNASQISQLQQQSHQPQIQAQQLSNSLPMQNTIIPIPDDQSSADLNFFLALLPDIKIMNQEQKRKLRIGTLKLIDDILSNTN